MPWSKERRDNGPQAPPPAAISRQGCGQCDVQGGPQSSRDACRSEPIARRRGAALAVFAKHTLRLPALLRHRHDAVTRDAPMSTSLVPAPELPDLPASLRTPGDRKVALWPSACPQSCGFPADAAHDNSRGCGQTFQTAGDERRCRLSWPGVDTFICLRPFTFWRSAGCDGATKPLAPGAGKALEDPVCRAQGIARIGRQGRRAQAVGCLTLCGVALI